MIFTLRKTRELLDDFKITPSIKLTITMFTSYCKLQASSYRKKSEKMGIIYEFYVLFPQITQSI